MQVDSGKSFKVVVRFDTDVELEYFRHGGILNFMVRKLILNVTINFDCFVDDSRNSY